MTDYKQLCAELLEAWDTAPTPSAFVDTNGYGTIQRIRAALAKPESSGNVTDDSHPITPPDELLQRWEDQWFDNAAPDVDIQTWIATNAARWGADKELDACCEWVENECPGYGGPYEKLRAARRPKPPSLKEQALKELHHLVERLPEGTLFSDAAILRAIESLPE